MLRLERLALASTHAAAMLTTTPITATTRTGPPSTAGGWISRRMASKATIADTTSRVMPLPAAERISARFHPNVHDPVAGRAARRIAHNEPPIAPTSESMCPASESSANDPEVSATTTSVTMNATSSSNAISR